MLEFTKEDIEKLNKQEFDELSMKINNETKWRSLEAKAMFYKILANSQIPQVKKIQSRK